MLCSRLRSKLFKIQDIFKIRKEIKERNNIVIKFKSLELTHVKTLERLILLLIHFLQHQIFIKLLQFITLPQKIQKKTLMLLFLWMF